LPLSIGTRAHVHGHGGSTWLEAECIGFENQTTFLMALDHVNGLAPGAKVYPLMTPDLTPDGYRQREGVKSLGVGRALLGRVVDGLGRPLDGLGGDHVWAAKPPTPSANPLRRVPVTDFLDTGVRAINTMLTVGRGQRIGLFAGSGVGKSVLLSMMARNCAADVMVVPSMQENLPNTIMEPMSCGTPVVAFRTGGIPDLVEHRRTGYLAERFDMTDLARGITWTLEQSGADFSPGKNAREKVEREFAIDVVSARYMKLYAELTGGADGRK
jgi:vacuolar-type H+-ATPase catalytic subunit A/Vma1